MRAWELYETEKADLPDIEVGDELKIGKFKNRKVTVKGFKKDKNNHPVAKTTKGDVQLLKPRVTKLMPEEALESEEVLTDSTHRDTLMKKMFPKGKPAAPDKTSDEVKATLDKIKGK